jgi:catechol 2,3-dioxygenase-like lactoylglutathione lyase family enzyme
MISFEVENIKSVYNELKEKGVNFVFGIREFGEVKVSRFEDPDGNPLEIHEWK